ncbi:MAG TPA: hypothetical protein VM529_15970 [Gemmata sp.]|jgi:hypothetical protein|nr:hypothetical protein [Gemmata sp.]
MEEKVACGWVKLWHPAGVQVTLPVTGLDDNAADLFAHVDAYLAAGFTATPPGLASGEDFMLVDRIIRVSQADGRGGSTPTLHFYEVSNDYKSLTVYLDTMDQQLDFEHASGLAMADVKPFPGKAAPKFGDSPDSDQFFAKAKVPFRVVFKPNPKWNAEDEAKAKIAPGGIYKVPRRLFVRYANERPNPLAALPGFFAADPSVADINKKLGEMVALRDKDKAEAWRMFKEHADKAGLQFDGARREFFNPDTGTEPTQ